MALDNLHNVLLQLLFFIFLNEKIFAGRRESKEQERKKGLFPFPLLQAFRTAAVSHYFKFITGHESRLQLNSYSGFSHIYLSRCHNLPLT